MSKAQHTPGPWRVDRQNPSPTTGEWMIAGQKPGYLAEVRDCGSGDVDANARLIAAAPELLEALEHQLAWLISAEVELGSALNLGYAANVQKAVTVEKMRAAIAAAKGN